MSHREGDQIDLDGQTWTLVHYAAYQGKPGCQSWSCTRRGSKQLADGTWDLGQCYGWHCPQCHEPTSMMGHSCPVRN